MANFDDAKLCVEALTGGKNTVILDDRGMPSIMVRWEKQKNSAILTGGSDVVHPGSIVNGVEKTMYVSKFLNMVMNDRAYSLPFQDPKASVNFDQALAYCRNKKTAGGAWSIMPFSLWAQIALWCKKNGTMPRGNNNYGKDHGYAHEVATPSMALDSSNRVQRTATGSGPATWNHNWLPDGIADLNGNVNEWCGGLRIVDGEIQIIQNANCMDNDIPLTAASTYWKAIKNDGTLVDPGTSGTLKYDYLNSKITLIDGTVTDDGSSGRSTSFKDLAADAGLTVPELAKALILYPADSGDVYGGDYRWATLAGERLPLCGGSWGDAAVAGVFLVGLSGARSDSHHAVGFRSAFCEL